MQAMNRMRGMGAEAPGVIEREYAFRDFFAYELDFAALAAAGTATGTLIIQADSDFIWSKGTYFADVAAAALTDSTRVIPLVSVLITDSGSGRQLSNSAVPVASMFGTGEIPFILPRPRIFRAQTTVTIQVTNFSAATTYNLKLTLTGEKGFWK